MERQGQLTDRPDDERNAALWLQHAAGWLLFRDIRDYARGELSEDLDEQARRAAEEAIDHALYGVMMVADGINVPLRNARHAVDVRLVARLEDRDTEAVVTELDLRDGDGVCMGYHYWMEGDFGGAVEPA